jgi:hypothetical protein
LHVCTSDTGLDGQGVMDGDELEETDLVAIDPLPSFVWYRDMADFAERISDERAARRLERAIRGRGAFRRSMSRASQSSAAVLVANVTGALRRSPSGPV